VAWARKNPALAAGGAAGAGLAGFVLYKRNQANAPADTAGDTAAAGIGPPAAFTGGGGDPVGEFEQQLASLQSQIGAITAATTPTQPQKAFSLYALARSILQRSGNANPTPQQIARERRRLLRVLGPAPAPAPAPAPQPHPMLPARRMPGTRIVSGTRR